MLVYLDTNVVIYAVEQPPDLGPRTLAALTGLLEAGHRLAASHLVRMECMVAPLRHADAKRLAQYHVFFSETVDEVLELTSEVFDTAAEFRARYALRTVDALHAAAAVHGGCDMLLSNDQHLSACAGITIMQLAPAGQE